jgi:tRNA-modifying protein YgfZ
LRYSSFDVVALRGFEALAFAQAQLASDVLSLEDRGWQWCAYLTPQGRTIALFAVVRHGAEAIDLLVPAQRGAELAARLQRFVFRTRVRLEVRTDVQARAMAHGGAGAAVVEGETSQQYRLALADGLSLDVAPGLGDGAEAALRAHLVAAAVPLLAGAAVEAHTPHALGLDALGAISTRKGCYPGQEIVARTHFLGRNKRHLWRFTIEGDAAAPEPGEAFVDAAGQAAAETVLSLKDETGTVRGLAVAHEQALEGGIPLNLGDRTASFVRAR